MHDDNGTKWLPAARLIELLQELPSYSRVMPNAVGNLLAMTANGERALAYVDFARGGSVESMEHDAE